MISNVTHEANVHALYNRRSNKRIHYDTLFDIYFLMILTSE